MKRQCFAAFAAMFLSSLCYAQDAVTAAPKNFKPQGSKPVRIGLVTFLSGPGAGFFGVSARNAAELTIEALNSGSVPAPYQTKGFGGHPLEMVVIDEAGGTSRVVTDYRNLVERRNVDLVIGPVSSGNCLGVAPVAEELKMLTVFFTCGTPGCLKNRSTAMYFVQTPIPPWKTLPRRCTSRRLCPV